MRIHAASTSQLRSTVQSSGPTIPEEKFHVSFLPKDVPSMPHSVSIPSKNSIGYPYHPIPAAPVVKRPCSVRSVVISLNPSSTRNCDVVHHPAKAPNPSASLSKVTHWCNYSITICEYTLHLKWRSTNHSSIFQTQHSPILLHHHLDCSTTRKIVAFSPFEKTELQHWPYRDEISAIQRFLCTNVHRSFLCVLGSPAPLPAPKNPFVTSHLCSHLLLQCGRSNYMQLLIILCTWIWLQSDPWSCHPPK